ncbi:MAG: hypothetical protein E6J23_12085 [Chloroflexi bacterium]|nr:MAG: hypothetical protein E6J23_12085 [Chloroflexota bacterium]
MRRRVGGSRGGLTPRRRRPRPRCGAPERCRRCAARRSAAVPGSRSRTRARPPAWVREVRPRASRRLP